MDDVVDVLKMYYGLYYDRQWSRKLCCKLLYSICMSNTDLTAYNMNIYYK